MKRSKWSLTFFIWIWVQNFFQFRVKICNLTCASLHDTIIYRSRICTLPKQNKILDCTLVFLVRGLQLSESFTYKKNIRQWLLFVFRRCILLYWSIFCLAVLGCSGWSYRKKANHYIFSRFSVSTIFLDIAAFLIYINSL